MTKRKGAHGDDCDVLVIGSGLGGRVAAVELTEKGDRMRVSAVWWNMSDKGFAETAWYIKRFAWLLGLTGTRQILLLVHRCRRSIRAK
jgi:succinate dehydrogenase/fumarate reductase flavoprotein subunit